MLVYGLNELQLLLSNRVKLERWITKDFERLRQQIMALLSVALLAFKSFVLNL